MIEPLGGPYDCVRAIGAFAALHAAALPAFTVEGLVDDLAIASPVARWHNGAERLWAVLSELEDPAKAAAAMLVGQIAGHAMNHGVTALGATDRGAKMLGACRRILGEDGADQDPASDPAPLADFVPPEAE